MTSDSVKLIELCKRFIETNQISCAETIHQSDRVIESAYVFIEDICNLVGYIDSPDQ